MGVALFPARAAALEASRGATDFGEYFTYFSFFLMVSALMLTVLFFKLGIEQRLRQIGILRASGYSMPVIRRLLLSEATVLAVVGALVGIVGAVLYGRLIVYGLGTWWVGAVGTTRLQLHVSPVSLTRRCARRHNRGNRLRARVATRGGARYSTRSPDEPVSGRVESSRSIARHAAAACWRSPAALPRSHCWPSDSSCRQRRPAHFSPAVRSCSLRRSSGWPAGCDGATLDRLPVAARGPSRASGSAAPRSGQRAAFSPPR